MASENVLVETLLSPSQPGIIAGTIVPSTVEVRSEKLQLHKMNYNFLSSSRSRSHSVSFSIWLNPLIWHCLNRLNEHSNVDYVCVFALRTIFDRYACKENVIRNQNYKWNVGSLHANLYENESVRESYTRN